MEHCFVLAPTEEVAAGQATAALEDSEPLAKATLALRAAMTRAVAPEILLAAAAAALELLVKTEYQAAAAMEARDESAKSLALNATTLVAAALACKILAVTDSSPPAAVPGVEAVVASTLTEKTARTGPGVEAVEAALITTEAAAARAS